MKGGGKTHFLELAYKLNTNTDMLVMVPGYSPRPKNKYGLPIKFIPVFKKNILSYLLYELLTFFYMIRYQIKFKPDIIYCRPIYATIFPSVVAKIFNTKFVVEQNAIREDELRLRNTSPIMIRLSNAVEHLNYHIAERVITVSEGIKNELVKRFGLTKAKIDVVPNGVNIEKFVPLEKEECRAKLSLGRNYFCVGYVGSFAPWQGIESLIEAARLVKKQGYERIKYMLVGGDGERDRVLKQRVRKYGLKKEILFVGRVNYEQIVYYINAFDVAIAPFIRERNSVIGLSPLKFFEYLACGKPVITSRIEGVEKLIEAAKCGYLFEPNDVEGLAKSIIESYCRSNELDELGKRGRKLVETRYNWEITAQRVQGVLEETAGKRALES